MIMNQRSLHRTTIFWSILLAVCIPAAICAYEPPTGIPDPGFGIDSVLPPRPGSWTAEIAGYFYVNPSAPGCSDSRAYGHPASPRCTIPEPVPAGSYVEVHGTYTHTVGGTTNITGKGTGGAWAAGVSGPAWIVGQASDRPVFTQRTILSGKHLYVDGIATRWDANDESIVIGTNGPGSGSEFIVVRNCLIEGDQKSRTFGVVLGGRSEAETVTQVVVYNNRIFNHGDMTSGDQDADCLNAGNFSNRIWFLNNTVHTASGAGGWAGGPYGGSENCHHIYFGFNRIYNTRQAGLAVKYATDVIFSQNLIHDIVDTSWSPSKGVGYQYAPQRLWILFNEIHGARYGIYGASTQAGDWRIYAVGNLIYNIHATGDYEGGSWSEAGIMMKGGSRVTVVHNTLVDCDAGINAPGTEVTYQIENNLIANVAKANGNHVFIEYATAGSVLKNSILFQAGGAERIKWGSKAYDLPGFQAASGKGQNCLNSDPRFANSSAKDFRPLPGSPAIDSGSADAELATPVYQEFYTAYGVDIARDFRRAPRPQGSRWDIGAYEYDASDPGRPQPPKNLRILF
jgi:hypothetical protein